jgi:hypothetical protein
MLQMQPMPTAKKTHTGTSVNRDSTRFTILLLLPDQRPCKSPIASFRRCSCSVRTQTGTYYKFSCKLRKQDPNSNPDSICLPKEISNSRSIRSDGYQTWSWLEFQLHQNFQFPCVFLQMCKWRFQGLIVLKICHASFCTEAHQCLTRYTIW